MERGWAAVEGLPPWRPGRQQICDRKGWQSWICGFPWGKKITMTHQTDWTVNCLTRMWSSLWVKSQKRAKRRTWAQQSWPNSWRGWSRTRPTTSGSLTGLRFVLPPFYRLKLRNVNIFPTHLIVFLFVFLLLCVCAAGQFGWATDLQQYVCKIHDDLHLSVRRHLWVHAFFIEAFPQCTLFLPTSTLTGWLRYFKRSEWCFAQLFAAGLVKWN